MPTGLDLSTALPADLQPGLPPGTVLTGPAVLRGRPRVLRGASELRMPPVRRMQRRRGVRARRLGRRDVRVRLSSCDLAPRFRSRMSGGSNSLDPTDVVPKRRLREPMRPMTAILFAPALAAVGCEHGVATGHDAASDLADHDVGNADLPPAPQPFFEDPFRLCPNADAGAPESGNGDASGGGDPDASDGGTWRSGCPIEEPTGGACALADLRCDYGDAINLMCRRRWMCANGNWLVTGGCSGQRLPPACPIGATADAGACMNLVDDGCSYPNGDLCGCYVVGSPPKCLRQIHDSPDCPAQVPFQGADCSLAPVNCGYGGQIGWRAVCCHGSWQVAPYVVVVGP
jgi:hypothetical protein